MNEFARNDPVEITIFYTFVEVIFVKVEIIEVNPPCSVRESVAGSLALCVGTRKMQASAVVGRQGWPHLKVLPCRQRVDSRAP